MTSTVAPACSGSAMTSPGVSCENAIRPGPAASIMNIGSPARCRVHGFDSGIWVSVTDGSCHKITWCGKNRPSPAARLQSATEQMPPSIWTFDCPAWMRVMSAIGGCSVQPPDVVRRRTSTGAPQSGQLLVAPADC